MIQIPAGPFRMGDTFSARAAGLAAFPAWWSNQTPVHTVFVSAFAIEQTETTQAQWDKVAAWANSNGYCFAISDYTAQFPNQPVIGVTWPDAMAWCNARSEMEGRTPLFYTDAFQTQVYRRGPILALNANLKTDAAQPGYRLPTEAEWEKAARAGSAGQHFPWPSSAGSFANHINHTRAQYYYPNAFAPEAVITNHTESGTQYLMLPAKPVASFSTNGYGLYDMAGNVSEWCWDWYQSDWYTTSAATNADPLGPLIGEVKVVRGGSWWHSPQDLRCAARDGAKTGADYVGFRCVQPRPFTHSPPHHVQPINLADYIAIASNTMPPDILRFPPALLAKAETLLWALADEWGVSNAVAEIAVVGSFAQGCARIGGNNPSDLDCIIFLRPPVLLLHPCRDSNGHKLSNELDCGLGVDVAVEPVEDLQEDNPDCIFYSLTRRKIFGRPGHKPRNVKVVSVNSRWFAVDRDQYAPVADYQSTLNLRTKRDVMVERRGDALLFIAPDSGNVLLSLPFTPQKRAASMPQVLGAIAFLLIIFAALCVWARK